MYPVQLTSQGQISLPVAVRKLAGIEPGDRLLISHVGGKLEIIKDQGLASLKGIFAKYAVGKPSPTPAKIKKTREKLYTERYKRWPKQ